MPSQNTMGSSGGKDGLQSFSGSNGILEAKKTSQRHREQIEQAKPKNFAPLPAMPMNKAMSNQF